MIRRTLFGGALCCALASPAFAEGCGASRLSGPIPCGPTLAVAQLPQIGLASWYGAESGPKTASGERFDPEGMTCAMRSYRRGQQRSVRVTVLATGRNAVCRVNDHGPAAWTGKIIDVSAGMAKVLGFYSHGVARVRID